MYIWLVSFNRGFKQFTAKEKCLKTVKVQSTNAKFDLEKAAFKEDMIVLKHRSL